MKVCNISMVVLCCRRVVSQRSVSMFGTRMSLVVLTRAGQGSCVGLLTSALKDHAFTGGCLSLSSIWRLCLPSRE
jgi:hypothetical protein